MSSTAQGSLIGTSLPHAFAVAVVLFAITAPIAIRFAQRERQPWLANVVLVSLFLHFMGAFLQVQIVRIFYNNSADFNGYNLQGAALSADWRSGVFSLAESRGAIPGSGMVGVITGGVYTVFGVDQLGGFLVFTWFALLGLMAFYRAFRIVLPTGDHKRYALILFLLPSLWYWPSAAGKEAVMVLGLGVMTLGMAMIFTNRWTGLVPLLAGGVIGGLVRPHEVAMLFGSFAVAILTRRAVRRSLITPIRWAATLLVVGLGAVVVARVTADFLGISSLTGPALVEALTDANEATQGSGTGFGSSHASWSPNPLYLPYDAYLVLFNPLPFQVTSATQALAALENLTIIALIVASWRSLRSVFRHMRSSPFVVMCFVYSVGFIYVFSALGNVGLLARERTLLFPFFFALLALPKLASRAPEARPGNALDKPVLLPIDRPAIRTGRG